MQTRELAATRASSAPLADQRCPLLTPTADATVALLHARAGSTSCENAQRDQVGRLPINEFRRRQSGAPKLGEIIDIDILGPDNGSVALVAMSPTFFVFQTVHTKDEETGGHPEFGAREFGFERSGTVRFYTRGVSRPENLVVGMIGGLAQQEGWTCLAQGISESINALGGKSDASTISVYKVKRPD